MKIDLYAKKIGYSGAVYLNTVDVPDDFGDEYRVPVRGQATMQITTDDKTPPPQAVQRVFRYMPNPLQKFLGENKAYVEL